MNHAYRELWYCSCMQHGMRLAIFFLQIKNFRYQGLQNRRKSTYFIDKTNFVLSLECKCICIYFAYNCHNARQIWELGYMYLNIKVKIQINQEKKKQIAIRIEKILFFSNGQMSFYLLPRFPSNLRRNFTIHKYIL